MKYDSLNKTEDERFGIIALRKDLESWKSEYHNLEDKYLTTQIELGKARGLAKHYEIIINELKAEIALLQQNVKY